VNPAARKQLVTQLVGSGVIESQEDLVKALKKNGVVVTQTTASRDLLEIGALRGPDSTGRTRYILQATPTTSSGSTRNLLLSAVPSGNLVVAKTPPGGAQLLAGRIDGAISQGDLPNAIGTIAGDDTVIVVSASATGGASLARELTAFLDGEPLKSHSRRASQTRTKQKRSK
jgi:transcriptional regulator of arginine metabolism